LTDKRKLKSFGILTGSIFLAVAAWPAVSRHGTLRLWLAIPSGALFLLGLVAPGVLRRPFDLWMRLAQALGWINTRILLTLVFYLVITPAALAMRLLRFDPMNRVFLPDSASYGVRKEARPASHMDRQF